ncbi:DUF2325 domain-containing protein [Janthinobacterium sp. PSPC3-1]|uniref:DUF2325 domain-containing protein n=1 Tax=Janthinobacterium sp. PSPC3-1 TaxID=2804653 RepID=UPI003CE8F593
MCDKDKSLPVISNCSASDADTAALTSRRRRLWELSHTCHCPLVGVGLPLGYLRKLVGKMTGGRVLADDYEVHVGAVTECGARNRLSEALQKELERRYAPVILRFRGAKSKEQVAQLWRTAVANGDVSGAFWAGLTHPRCDAELEEQMCRDLHMIQHQAGACVRADMGKFSALQEENVRLAQELARLQQRGQAMLQEKTGELERQEAVLLRTRAEAIGKDSVIEGLRAELAQLQAAIPSLESRTRLVERLAQMDEREKELRLQITELKAQPRPAAAVPPPAPKLEAPSGGKLKMPIRLVDQSVLCVGGRSGNVATYRALIERVGAQFAHHDGGLEDNANLLDSSLAAADLVICQTGCISHSAYWRVKDYCKRTGKRCVFIDNPSISSLARGLQEVSGELAPAAQHATSE